MKLSVISPTYNEAENIRPLLAALKQSLRDLDHEIVISDGDSPDRTWELAEAAAAHDPTIQVLRRGENNGLGSAIMDGFSAARGEVVACIDADLQHDPTILPEMLSQLEKGADLVVGSRYIAGGGTGSWNLPRLLASKIATRMAQSALGTGLRDPLSGYFMLRREDFLRVRDRLDGDGFKIMLEIVAYLKPQRVSEVPYVFRTRTAGQSKLSRKVVAKYVRQLWRLRRE